MKALARGPATGPDAATNQRPPQLHYTGKGSLVQGACISHEEFFSKLQDCIRRTEVSGELVEYDTASVEGALAGLAKKVRDVSKKGGRVILIGNGGSAAIASHMAIDWTKNGGIRSMALNDAPTLTCLANDFGYEQVFAKQLEYQATKKDLVIIISSSGKSPNIIRAAKQCDGLGSDCPLVTFSGMNPNNQLRRMGLLNFYTPASDYGLVELTHFVLLHSIVSVAS